MTTATQHFRNLVDWLNRVLGDGITYLFNFIQTHQESRLWGGIIFSVLGGVYFVGDKEGARACSR